MEHFGDPPQEPGTESNDDDHHGSGEEGPPQEFGDEFYEQVDLGPGEEGSPQESGAEFDEHIHLRPGEGLPERDPLLDLVVESDEQAPWERQPAQGALPVPNGWRRALAEHALHDERVAQYAAYAKPQPHNGHFLKSFMPNGKRRCGILTCVNCTATLCFIRMDDESVETSLRTILHTPDGQSTNIEDIINTYFDSMCQSWRHRENDEISILGNLGSVLSLHSGLWTRDTHAISQGIKRARQQELRRGDNVFCNRAIPLSAVLGQ